MLVLCNDERVIFIPAGQDERVRVTELLTSRDSPLALLRGAVKMALSSMEVIIVAGFPFSAGLHACFKRNTMAGCQNAGSFWITAE